MRDGKGNDDALILSGLDRMGVGVAILSPDGTVLYHNRAVADFFPTADAIAGRGYGDLIRDLIRDGAIAGKAVLENADGWFDRHLGLLGGSASALSEQLSDGRWISIEAAALDDEGRILTFSDITDAKKEQLRLYDIVDNTGDGFALWDQTDRLVHCNQVYADLHTVEGRVPEVGEAYEAVMMRVMGEVTFLIGEDEGMWVKRRMAERRTPLSRETLEHNSGKWFLLTERRARDGGVVSSLSDISQIKKNEKEMMTAVQDMDLVRIRMEEQTAEVTTMAEELHTAKQEADRASRAKTDFLSKMSHDLRTPLNAILGFGQLLEMDAEEDVPFSDESRESIDQIMKAGEHLLDLINEVLDLARIESGRTELDIEVVDAASLAGDGISLTQALAEKRGIDFTLSVAEDAPKVLVDKTRLRQILVNLMSNAIKYNNENGSVTVTVEMAPGAMVALAVADTGPGIPDDMQEGVFEPFNRAGADKTQTEGTGIGLAIVKSLVELMNGRIELQSRVGEGSVFTVYLPAADGE